MLPVRRLLLAADLSDASPEVFRWAADLADRYGAAVDVLHVLDDLDLPGLFGDLDHPAAHGFPELERRVERELRALADRSNLSGDVTLVVLEADEAADAIVAYARERGHDLIVVGSQGRSGLERLLVGSTAAAVVRKAPCPVFVVKPPSE